MQKQLSYFIITNQALQCQVVFIKKGTEALVKAGKLLDLPKLDHVIIIGSDGGYLSFTENPLQWLTGKA